MSILSVISLVATVFCLAIAIPEEFIRNQDEIGISFIQELMRSENGNFMLGLFPLQEMLALMSTGTKGETLSQIRQLLRSNCSDDQITEEYRRVIRELQNIPHFKVNLSNRMFIRDGLEIQPSFFERASSLSTTVEKFGLKTKRRIESRRDPRLEKPMNQNMKTWLEQNLTLQNNIALLNSMYVNGKWLQGFDRRLTKKMDFHVSSTESMKVDMMKITGYFMVSRSPSLGVKLIKMPFENERAQMIIALTDKVDALETVISENAMKLWNERHFVREYITLYMPKFEMTSSMDITPTLMKMGISKLFSDADLSGINDQLTKVALISQKLHVVVNERGTSAVNWPLMEDNHIEKDRELTHPADTIKIDHPFFFGVLYDDMSLMFGRINRP